MDEQENPRFRPQFSPPPDIRAGEGEDAPPRYTPAFSPLPNIRGGETEPLPAKYSAGFSQPPRIRDQLADRGRVPSVTFNHWKGLFSNANPHVIGNQYLQVQRNLTSAITGQLQVRSGMRAVEFDVDV